MLTHLRHPKRVEEVKMPENDLVNILLVDDDPDCRLFIRDAIEDGNLCNAVYEVEDGKEALDFLCRRDGHSAAPEIGLVYLDIEMPGMSGQEVLKAIRSDKCFDNVPVVMMTGVTDDREKAEAAANGANSYTVKPHDPVEFMKTVMEATNYWIDIHKRPSCVTDRPAKVQAETKKGACEGGQP